MLYTNLLKGDNNYVFITTCLGALNAIIRPKVKVILFINKIDK
jgi:hypothetical protein